MLHSLTAGKHYRSISLAVLILVILSTVACRYEFPLADPRDIMLDNRVMGAWLRYDGGQVAGRDEQLRILGYSNSAYMVHYTVDEKALYFRAYPIEVAGLSLVQLELIGTHEGPVAGDVHRLYHVVGYQLDDDELTVRTINTQLLGEDVDSRSDLLEAVTRHSNNNTLLVNPMVFTRVSPGAG